MEYFKQKARHHLFWSWWVYLFVGLFFVAGLVFGAMGVTVLDAETNTNLGAFLDEGISRLEQSLSFSETTRQAVLKNLGNLGKIGFLGMTVLGFPLVLIMIFTRGFALGFTIAFLVRDKALRGAALVLLAVLPPNLLAVPAYLVAAATAINFTFYLIRGRNGQRITPLNQYLLGYLLMMAFFSLILIGASFLEGYFSPLMIRLLGFGKFTGA